jgi:ABC-type branched-subunit amino acid transport system substrate-binding protein
MRRAKPRKLFAFGAVAAVAMGLIGPVGVAGAANGNCEVVLGVVGPFSGPYESSFGPTQKQGVEARVKEAKGEVGGCSIKIEYADNQSNPDSELTAVRDLVENKNAAVIVAWDPFLLLAAEYLGQNQIPAVGPSFAGSSVSAPGLENILTVPASPDPASPTYTSWVKFYKNSPGDKWALFASDQESSGETSTRDEDAIKEAGKEVVYTNHNVSQTGTENYAADVLKLKEVGADAIGSQLPVSESVKLVTAARQAGLELKSISATGAIIDQSILDDAATTKALEGASGNALWAPVSADFPGAKRMMKWLHKAGFEGTIPTFGAGGGYVLTDLAIEGLNQTGTETLQGGDMTAIRSAFLDKLHAIDDYDARGALASPDNLTLAARGKSDPSGDCLTFLKLKNGKFTVVNKTPYCGKPVPGTGHTPSQ